MSTDPKHTTSADVLYRCIGLRHRLHAHPDLSGSETHSAQEIQDFFQDLTPDKTWTAVGGHGVAFAFSSGAPGPTVLLRCELDALPIHETTDLAHRSTVPGVSHKCGHDGHMATLAAVGCRLAAERPKRGRVILLFQPAEETGVGAQAVVESEAFAEMRPDWAFAIHNLPGFPLGQVVVRSGVLNAASRGLSIQLTGATAHAAQPETGRSPVLAVASLLRDLPNLPTMALPSDPISSVTMVGCTLGEKAFGTAPGSAEVWATLRAETDSSMAELAGAAEALVEHIAEAQDLAWSVRYQDIFAATVNSPAAVDHVTQAADLPTTIPASPFRWSEDFGAIAATCDGALIGLGAGETCPPLHNEDYDFPDELIEVGSELLLRVVDRVMETVE